MKKFIGMVLIVSMILGLIPYTAFATDLIISVQNGILEYKVNPANGRFTIHTAEGLPNKASDNDKNLLFLKKTPDTSFTTFRVDGEDYIFGNTYGLLGTEGKIISGPKVNGTITTTVWKIKNIQVTQHLQLINDESNPNVGNTRITYTVENNSGKSVSLGSRILLDTQLGSNDASPMLIGSTYVTNEKEYIGNAVPVSWKSSDAVFAAGVISYGLLSGWDNVVPDRFVVGHWQSLSKTKWDFTPNAQINFTNDINMYGSADSAAAIYYKPKELKRGAQIVYETYYGIGSLSDARRDSGFNLQVVAPSKLTVNNTKSGYKEESFKVSVTIDNNGDNAVNISNAKISLGLSTELDFAEGQPQEYIKDIGVGETAYVEFTVVPKTSKTTKVAEAGVTILYGDEFAQSVKYITLPSIKGTPPTVQMTEVSPQIAYTKSTKKTFIIKGSEFNLLKSDMNMSMKIVGQNNATSQTIKSKDITIGDDVITIELDNSYTFKADTYDIVLTTSSYGTMTKSVEMSSNKIYERKVYGTLLMGGFEKDANGKPVYSAKALKTEAEYEALDQDTKDKTLLTIRGDITEYEVDGETEYQCGSGTIINQSILYEAPLLEPNKCLTIKTYKKGGVAWWGKIVDSLALSGTGFLTVGDYTFHYGDFYVVLADTIEYELAAAVGAAPVEDYNWPDPVSTTAKNKVEIVTPVNVVAGAILKAVGPLSGLKITIKNAVIGTNTVSLGGSVGIGLPWKKDEPEEETKPDADPNKEKAAQLKAKFDKNESTSGQLTNGQKTDDIISISLDELRFGVDAKNNNAQLVGLIANGSIKLEDGSIPAMDTGGAHVALSLNSIDYPGMYAKMNAGFKINNLFEADATVALVFETGGDCIPDSVELIFGGLKIPLGAGPACVGYLTKLGGGVYNLYKTIKGQYNVLPPITLKLITGYADPTLYSLTMPTISMEVGPNGVQFTGEEGKVVGIKIIEKINSKFLLYFTKVDDKMIPSFEISASETINILNIIKGEGTIWLKEDPRISGIFGDLSLGGKLYAGIYVPTYIPLVGGIELAGVDAELSTTRVYAGVRIIGIPYSVGYYWADKKTKFNTDFAYTAEELNIPKEEYQNALAYQRVGNETNTDGLLLYGTNFRQTYSSKNSTNGALLGYDTTHVIPVSNQKYGLFELQYTGEMPTISVKKPNGDNYPLILNENYRIQTIDSKDSKSGITEQKVYISVQDPEDGDWKIETNKAVDCTAMNVLPLPELGAISCQKLPDNKLKVDWSALNVDDSYKVEIHISEKQKIVDPADYVGREEEYNKAMADGYDPGITVASDISAKAGTATVDLGEKLANGEYQARVVLKKGNDNFDSEMSTQTFTYVNPNIPATPANVHVSLGGDGQYKVEYDKVEGVTGYYVTVLDENGKALEGFDGMQTQNTKVYVGGKVSVPTGTDADGKPTGFKIGGVIPGNSYRVKVTAYNEKDMATYPSDAYISDPIVMTEPNPATITLKLNDTTTTEADGLNPSTVGALTNLSESVAHYVSNQDVTVAYFIDGVTDYSMHDVKANVPFDVPLHLKDGGTVIEFLAVNSANDYTTSKLIATLDQTPPQLALNACSILSTNGRYEIIGTCEPNSKVYIGDEKVLAPVVNGSFSYIGQQKKTRDEVKVTAVDIAGNETQMLVEVIPEEISSFDSIVIKGENNVIVDELNLKPGDLAKIKVFGVSDSGKEFELDNDNVQYSIIQGNDKITIDADGKIEGQYYGEAVVLCKYNVSDEYSFEQTMKASVQQSPESAKDIRISTLDVTTSQVGATIARLSIPDAPIGVTYAFNLESNPYFDLFGTYLVLKKPLDQPSASISITAQGSQVLEGVYEDIGIPISKTFTLRAVKTIVSVENSDSITVYSGTSFDKLALPEKVKVTLNTGEVVDYPVIWNQGAYQDDMAFTYNLKGTIESGELVLNPNEVFAKISVTVKKRSASNPLTSEVVYTGLAYDYKGETLVVSSKDASNSVTLSKELLDKKTDNLQIILGGSEVLLDNATCKVLKDAGAFGVNISVIQKGQSIHVDIGGLKKAKGLVKADLGDKKLKDPYSLIVMKDGKIIPDSYFDETTGKIVFAIDGSGEYTMEKKVFSYQDMKKHWAKDAVSFLSVRSMLSGVGNNQFSPQKIVTKAEFVKMLITAAGIQPKNNTVTAKDVKAKDWFAPYVGFAMTNGIASAGTDGRFNPGKALTREEMMVILSAYMDYMGINADSGKIKYSDRDDISMEAVSAVQKMTTLGLISGDTNGKVMPHKKTTRAECAVVMMRCVKLLTEKMMYRG